MDLIGFVGVIFMGLHGISWGIMGYIYIYILYTNIYIYPFCLVCLAVFWGLLMENHVLEASPTGD